ncbi:response regulator [Rhizorhabdus histidinilytica]|uniref:response regulator n=1 Tax=Rhizorhabdus histidinilytica TaxID=439228 RepID=UPI001AD98EE0|nr:response regulator [Rhizorhabdus histidinilytica]
MDADVPNLDRPRAVTLDTPLRILIADDDELLSEMMTLQLAEAGCEVHCVADGRLALAAIEDSSFDVLITDWQMPNLDGINLVRHLRTYPPSNYMHIIMMTTRAAQRTVQEALAVEVDAFLYKPIDQTQLELGLGSARRIVSLERRLRRRNHHLAAAHAPARPMTASRRTSMLRPRSSGESCRSPICREISDTRRCSCPAMTWVGIAITSSRWVKINICFSWSTSAAMVCRRRCVPSSSIISSALWRPPRQRN